MANLGGSWTKLGTEDVVQVADIPVRVAAHPFELGQLFSDVDHPRPAAEVVKMTDAVEKVGFQTA